MKEKKKLTRLGLLYLFDKSVVLHKCGPISDSSDNCQRCLQKKKQSLLVKSSILGERSKNI